MTVSVSGSQITFADNSTQNTSATGFGFKNRIINGAMMIDQRNAGASVSANNNFTVDRWAASANQTSKYTVQQNAGSVTPPVGFSKYLGVTSSSAYSVLSTDLFCLQYAIEGYNVADMNWGTANAATFTISFWVRSSLTGTFGGATRGYDGASAVRSYPFTYTISSANTWEYKTITIAGDTNASTAWTSTQSLTNGYGLLINFGLGCGSNYSSTANSWQTGNYLTANGATSVVGTNGATFYITGVQLEKGSTATSFDYRPYGTELQLCQRYYEKSYDIGTALGSVTVAGFAAAQAFNTTSGQQAVIARFNQEKRSSPTMAYWDGNGNASKVSTISSGGAWTANVAAGGFVDTSTKQSKMIISSATNWGFGYQWTADAEL